MLAVRTNRIAQLTHDPAPLAPLAPRTAALAPVTGPTLPASIATDIARLHDEYPDAQAIVDDLRTDLSPDSHPALFANCSDVLDFEPARELCLPFVRLSAKAMMIPEQQARARLIRACAVARYSPTATAEVLRAYTEARVASGPDWAHRSLYANDALITRELKDDVNSATDTKLMREDVRIRERLVSESRTNLDAIDSAVTKILPPVDVLWAEIEAGFAAAQQELAIATLLSGALADLDVAARALGLPITRVIKRGCDAFALELAGSQVLELGNTRQAMNQRNLRERAFALGFVVRRLPTDAWDAVLTIFARSWADLPSDDRGPVHADLRAFLTSLRQRDDRASAMADGQSFSDGQAEYIAPDDAEAVGRERLKGSGFRLTSISYKQCDGSRASRRYWYRRV